MNEFTHLSLVQILTRITPVSVVVAAVIGVVRFRRLPPNLRTLAGLIWFVLPLELLGLVLMLQQRNNLFVMPIWLIGEFALLTLVYGQTLKSAAFTRRMPWVVAAFTAYALFDSLYVGDLKQYRPGQQVIESILVLMLVGLYFRKLLHELRVPQLRHEPMFWVSAGLLVYYLGYLQIALFSNYLLRYSPQFSMNIWAVHSLLFMALFGCYSKALWLPPQK